MKTIYEMHVNGDDLDLARFLLTPFRRLPSPEIPSLVSGVGEEIVLQLKSSDLFGLGTGSFPSVRSVLLHGSRALNDSVPFSDVDLLLVLDDSKARPRRELKSDILKLRRLCCAIYMLDPLMHHGLMFLNASDLAAYDQTFLPLATLAESQCLYGEPNLRIRLAAQVPLELCRRRFVQHVRTLRGFEFSPYHQQDYSLKSFLAGVLLLPVWFLAAQGRFVHKRDSFHVAYRDFPNLRWEAVKIAEGIRREWIAARIHPLHRLALQALSTKARMLAHRFYRANFLRHRGALELLQQQMPGLAVSAEAAL